MTSDKPVDTTAAEAYEQHMVPGMFLPRTRVLIERAAPKPGEHVLDVACGTGIAGRLAAPLVGATGKVVGVVAGGALTYPTCTHVLTVHVDAANGGIS